MTSKDLVPFNTPPRSLATCCHEPRNLEVFDNARPFGFTPVIIPSEVVETQRTFVRDRPHHPPPDPDSGWDGLLWKSDNVRLAVSLKAFAKLKTALVIFTGAGGTSILTYLLCRM